MTADPLIPVERVQRAVADAARGLPECNPRAQVFFEARVDHRIVLASSGPRESVTTRTQGGAMVSGNSFHATEPHWLPGVEHPEQDWVVGLEPLIAEAASRASAGRGQPAWSARLVSFRQHVWVGSPTSDVVQDVREGCRLELRVRVGGTKSGESLEDLGFRPAGPWPIAAAFERTFDRAELRCSMVPPPSSGQTTAVFAPGAAGVVAHELIGHALEGDVVLRGRSWIGNGQLPAGGRPLTVVDDPRQGRGAWQIDDEGVAARETVLVDQGRPVGVLTDRVTAEALSLPLTGHGRRSSYLEVVRPRMGCTFIEAGTDDPLETVRSTPKGVFIRRLATGHTDPSAGRATFVVTDADRIEAGRISGPIEAFILVLEGRDAWGSIDRVGHDLQFDTCIGSCLRDGQPLAVSVGAPTIRIGVVGIHF